MGAEVALLLLCFVAFISPWPVSCAPKGIAKCATTPFVGHVRSPFDVSCSSGVQLLSVLNGTAYPNHAVTLVRVRSLNCLLDEDTALFPRVCLGRRTNPEEPLAADREVPPLLTSSKSLQRIARENKLLLLFKNHMMEQYSCDAAEDCWFHFVDVIDAGDDDTTSPAIISLVDVLFSLNVSSTVSGVLLLSEHSSPNRLQSTFFVVSNGGDQRYHSNSNTNNILHQYLRDLDYAAEINVFNVSRGLRSSVLKRKRVVSVRHLLESTVDSKGPGGRARLVTRALHATGNNGLRKGAAQTLAMRLTTLDPLTLLGDSLYRLDSFDDNVTTPLLAAAKRFAFEAWCNVTGGGKNTTEGIGKKPVGKKPAGLTSQLKSTPDKKRQKDEKGVTRSSCWDSLRAKEKQLALLSVMEKELVARVPAMLPALCPYLQSIGDRGPHTELRLEETQVGIAIEPSVEVFQRVDSVDDLKMRIIEFGTRLRSTASDNDQEGLPLASGLISSFPPAQKFVVMIVNLTQCEDDAIDVERALLKWKSVLASPLLYGSVRSFYTLRSVAAAQTSGSRELDNTLLGEGHRAKGSCFSLVKAPSVGMHLPLSPRYISFESFGAADENDCPDNSRSSCLPSRKVTAIDIDVRNFTVAHLDGFCRVHHTGAVDVIAPLEVEGGELISFQSDSSRTFAENPLRRITSEAQWQSHVVGQRVGITAVVLLPRKVASTLPPTAASNRLKQTNEIVAAANYFSSIRIPEMVVNTYAMYLECLDERGEVPASPVSSTTTASDFEDHAAQVLMQTAKVKSLPAVVVLFGEDLSDDDVQRWQQEGRESFDIRRRRHMLSWFGNMSSSVSKKSPKDRRSGIQGNGAPVLLTSKKLVSLIKSTSDSVKRKVATPSSSALRYVGRIAEATLGTMLSKGAPPTASTSTLPQQEVVGLVSSQFVNGEAWWDRSVKPTTEHLLHQPVWHVVLSKERDHDDSRWNGKATSHEGRATPAVGSPQQRPTVDDLLERLGEPTTLRRNQRRNVQHHHRAVAEWTERQSLALIGWEGLRQLSSHDTKHDEISRLGGGRTASLRNVVSKKAFDEALRSCGNNRTEPCDLVVLTPS